MKSQEKIREFRGMSAEDLKVAIASTEQELLNLRFRHAAGQLEQTAQLTLVKRMIAQARTVLNEKQRGDQATDQASGKE